MDLDIIQSTKEGEIKQFLCDVRDYFKASLATSEYENTSNMFYLTASETTEQLLSRCETLLNRLKNKNFVLPADTNGSDSNKISPSQTRQLKNHQWHCHRGRGNTNSDADDKNAIVVQQNRKEIDNEDVSYLDMSAAHYDNGKKQTLNGDLKSPGESDTTFRCSTFVARQNKSFLHRLHDNIINTTATTPIMADDESEAVETNKIKDNDGFEDDTEIYDICQVTTQGSDGEEDEVAELEETQKAIAQVSHSSLPNIDCPYMDLPAGHLSIKKAIKYGQLLKIEKRLFFDQSKKCYCGILNDWLLCYADGPTSNRPTVCLYLKMPGVEIEHFGEGKRREVCFQVTTGDPNRRFVFQAINEIDAKEWIHAIEAAIRIDITEADVRNSTTRKLPTPPVMKKITFLSSFKGGTSAPSCDGIYEEPSPIHQIATTSSPEKRPQLPRKQTNSFGLANKFEYDIPKCPPQPFKDNSANDEVALINPYERNETNANGKPHTITMSDSFYLTSSLPSTQKLNLKMEENLDFQAKVKDVHSKLTSQLSSGPNTNKSLKKCLSTTSQHNAEALSLSSPTSPLPETSELKKQKKTSTPSNSPQKMSSEKTSFAKNWFLNRLNKNTSSTRSNSSSPSNSPSKYKQCEKENLLNFSSDVCDGYDMHLSNSGSNPVSPMLKTSSPSTGTSKVNMIINQLEASGHLTVASFNSFSENEFNNYEPIVTVSTPPSSFIKKV